MCRPSTDRAKGLLPVIVAALLLLSLMMVVDSVMAGRKRGAVG